MNRQSVSFKTNIFYFFLQYLLSFAGFTISKWVCESASTIGFCESMRPSGIDFLLPWQVCGGSVQSNETLRY